MQSGSRVMQFPVERHRDYEQRRLLALANMTLKRLEFERRIQGGLLNQVEVVSEEAALTTELFSLARELGL